MARIREERVEWGQERGLEYKIPTAMGVTGLGTEEGRVHREQGGQQSGEPVGSGCVGVLGLLQGGGAN